MIAGKLTLISSGPEEMFVSTIVELNESETLPNQYDIQSLINPDFLSDLGNYNYPHRNEAMNVDLDGGKATTITGRFKDAQQTDKCYKVLVILEIENTETEIVEP